MDNLVTRVVAERLAAAGGAVLRFNFRGVGRSEGAHDGGRGEIDDLDAAGRLLAARHPQLPVWFAGYSFGAVVMLHAARDGRCASADPLIALAPPITHYSFDFLSELPNPVALVCGGEDTLTPGDELRRQTATWKNLLGAELLAGAGHDLGTHAGDTGPLEAAVDRSIRALCRP